MFLISQVLNSSDLFSCLYSSEEELVKIFLNLIFDVKFEAKQEDRGRIRFLTRKQSEGRHVDLKH